MVELSFDLRFAIIALETHVAKRHADIGLDRLRSTEEDVRRFVLEELRASGYAHDEAERDTAFKEIYLLEGELPRLETYGVLFVLFATFESVIKRLPGYVGNWSVGDVTGKSGDSFLGKAAKFYKDEVGVPLFSNPEQEKAVRLIADIRNAIGHATGRISLLKPRQRKRLESAIQTEPGLTIVDGSLQIDPNFVRNAAVVLDDTAGELIDRLKEAY